MKFNVCDEEFANSVELEKHQEREHPAGSLLSGGRAGVFGGGVVAATGELADR